MKKQIDRARCLTLPAPGRMGQVIAGHSFIRDAAARAAMTAHLGTVVPDVARLRGVHPDHVI